MTNDRANKGCPTLRLAADADETAPTQALKAKLRELTERLGEHNVFVVGQFVMWKPGLKNRKIPEYGEPAIVTAVLATPVFDPSEASAASPYFQEALTLVIGSYRDEDLLEFRVDGRRFEPVDR